MGKLIALLAAIIVIVAACSSATSSDSATGEAGGEEDGLTDDGETEESETGETGEFAFDLPVGEPVDFGPPPAVPEGDLSPEHAGAVELITSTDIDEIPFSAEQIDAIGLLGESGDPRVTWILTDILRFTRDSERANAISEASSSLLGQNFGPNDWNRITQLLIAWDIPEPPNYIDAKRAVFSSILVDWEPFFDPAGTVDWRLVSWGGVRIDDQPYNETPGTTCNCIPAVDNPETQPGSEAAWLEEDDIVFGVVINGEARAYPRQIMEVREMVNDSLGGRDFAIPYCTLCGSAQLWFTDTDNLEGFERPILRTSGLLIRSNKVMYELNTGSIFDTFLGDAQTGPFREAGIQLEQHTVVTSTWGAWLEENPDTDVLVEELALGRDFDFRNGRDANGPIFPIGDVDPRLDVQEDVLGIIQEDGTPIAFHVNSAIGALEAGQTVEVNGISIVLSGSGIKAVDADGNDIVGHQSFWFAWSQFNEGTDLWPEV